ncbi:hypothetical protein DFH06DRAFT_1130331 [Mycena polygramma]|nr:hypothetical protein DFH06DRAFT_1130331 [Mycena polygramma]
MPPGGIEPPPSSGTRIPYAYASRVTATVYGGMDVSSSWGNAGKSARDARYDLGARISALEDVSAPVPSNAITTAELSTAVAQRFDEVTADRDILNGKLTIQAQTQAATTADLRHENHLLRGELAAIRAAITRLELRGPAPLRQRSRSRSPHLSTRDHKKEPNSVRPHSPVPDLPAKRQRTAQGKGFLRLGPLPQSDLLPLAYFDTLIKRVLPTFVVTGQYSTSMDPEHAYHLRVTLDSVSQMAALKKAWDVAPRPFEFQDVVMHAVDGVAVINDSVSHSGAQPPVDLLRKLNTLRTAVQDATGTGGYRGHYHRLGRRAPPPAHLCTTNTRGRAPTRLQPEVLPIERSASFQLVFCMPDPLEWINTRTLENKWEMGLPAIVNGINNGITNGISTRDCGMLGISVSITASLTSRPPPQLSGFSCQPPAYVNLQETL